MDQKFIQWKLAQPPEFFKNVTEAKIFEIYKNQTFNSWRDSKPPEFFKNVTEAKIFEIYNLQKGN